MSLFDKKPSRFWRQPKVRWLLGIPLGGFVFFLLGAGALFAFHGVIEGSNTNAFCYSCHVGRDTTVEEYEASVHFQNPSGVQATCADCHVPKEFFPKMKVKIIAIGDIWHQITGKINLENFEEHRLEQAEHVWAGLRATDSRECRNCHLPESWNLARQSTRARTHHDPKRWAERGETCIDCHYGIAHKRPSIARATQ